MLEREALTMRTRLVVAQSPPILGFTPRELNIYESEIVNYWDDVSMAFTRAEQWVDAAIVQSRQDFGPWPTRHRLGVYKVFASARKKRLSPLGAFERIRSYMTAHGLSH